MAMWRNVREIKGSRWLSGTNGISESVEGPVVKNGADVTTRVRHIRPCHFRDKSESGEKLTGDFISALVELGRGHPPVVA